MTGKLLLTLTLGATACASPSSRCDGHIDLGEPCDDGNDDAFDSCDCAAAESAWVPPLGARDAAGFFVVEDDGAWCWFQDERAIFSDDRLVVSSVSHAGDLQVSSYDVATGAREHGMLRRRFERDDHDAASLLVRPDGRITAFYTRHDGFPAMYWRTQVGSELGLWGAEEKFTIDDDISYSNPFLLGDQLHLWFRGLDYNPTFAVSGDLGATWSTPRQVLDSSEVGWTGTVEHRPYVKYASNGTDTIHLIYTEGHPREFADTSLYHLYYKAGELRRSDGSIAAPLTTDEDADLAPEEGTLIHDGVRDGAAWVWDVELDGDERPVMVYSTYPARGSEHLDQRYRYARWDGDAWHTYPIAFAGRALYQREAFYAGGIALDPDDPNIVYFSSSVDPVTGAPSGEHHELYRGVTQDRGATWTITAITRASTTDNLRPVVPANHPPGTAVTWMQGTYHTYIDYDTRIVALVGAADATVTMQPHAQHETALARFPAAAAMTDGAMSLAVSNIEGTLVHGRGGELQRAHVYGSTAEDDAPPLAVALRGLTPGAPYTVRIHTYLPDDFALEPMTWSRGDDKIVAAHRPGNSATGADAYVDVGLVADWQGRIELSGRGVDDREGHRIAALSAVEVFARPRTLRADYVSVAVTSDRRQRDDESAIVARDRLAVDLDGLVPGKTYEITVHTAQTSARDTAASRWRVDAPGQLPRVVRSFERAGGSFSFTHVADTAQLRLYASDVYYRLSTNPSEIALAGVEVAEVVP